jgi:hypothetical protein
MYEKPTVIEIGKAEDVFFGLFGMGSDYDGSAIPGDLEFAEEWDQNSIE